ncbi:MAG: cupin domain-containing protein [Actinobacteria bacterium]|nr:cupin domain-containing protein [Actinomycetota bacterium]
MNPTDTSSGADQQVRPALARLLSVSFDDFADKHWGTAPLLSRADDLPSGFADLFSNDAVDELISRRGLRTPFLRVAKDGSTLADAEFTRAGGVGAGVTDQLSDDRLLDLFAGGSTLVLQALHRTWPPIIDFAGQLSTDLGHPVQVNSYTTPAQNTGFSSHYDVHDVFVLQIAGAKRWQIREPILTTPLRSQPWDQRRAQVEAASTGIPLLEVTLEPGDCLYLPRGYLHAATALGEISTHLTIGVHTWTRTHLLHTLSRYAVTRLADDADLRAALPPGLDWSGVPVAEADLELVRDRLVAALRQVRLSDLADALHTAHRGSQRAEPVAPVAGVAAAGTLTSADTLRLRGGLAPHLTETAAGADLLSRAGRRSITATDLPLVRRLLTEGRLSVADAGEDLARRLIVAGLVVIEPRQPPAG